MEENDKYTIKQVSEMLKMPAAAIRYFCNSGLVPYVRRDSRYHRVFEDWQINHIRIILGLRQAGLSKPELRRYARLVRQGRKTLPERKAMMETQKRQLWQDLENIRQGIDFLERQVELIDTEMTKARTDKKVEAK